MRETVTVRRATKQDQEAIWKIFQAVVKTGDTYVFAPDISKEEAMAYWMGADKHCYVAEIEDVVLGTYILKDNQPALGSHIGNASYMVSPSAQGRSIGRTLGKHSLVEGKKQGYHAIQFNIVISTNTPAVQLWKKLGFEIIGTTPEGFQHQGLGKLVDSYIMYRKL